MVYGQTSEPPAGGGSPFEPMKSRVLKVRGTVPIGKK